MNIRDKFLKRFGVPCGVVWDNDNCCFVAKIEGLGWLANMVQDAWEAFQFGYYIAMKQHKHVGYTNGANIKLLHETDYGAIYSTTDQNCFIPLYLLEDHIHRIETTGGDELTAKKMKSLVLRWGKK